MSPEEAVSLEWLLQEMDEEDIREVFSTFTCRDSKISEFLKEKAIEFEKAYKSRTYLFF